jgi:hypothetical protein
LKCPGMTYSNPNPPVYQEDPTYDHLLRRRLQIAHLQTAAHNEESTEETHNRRNRGLTLPPVSVVQIVILRNFTLGQGLTRKLVYRWKGQYIARKVRSPVNFDLECVSSGRSVVAHHRNILPILQDEEPRPNTYRGTLPPIIETPESTTEPAPEPVTPITPVPPPHTYNLRPRAGRT